MEITTEPMDIAKQIRHAIDPNGDSLGSIDDVNANPVLPSWLDTPEFRSAWDNLVANSRKYSALLSQIESAVRVLVPRGWAVFNMDGTVVDSAIELAKAGQGEDADELLADNWEGPGRWRTERICARLDVMGAGDDELHGWLQHRSRLIRKAKEHHEHGRYEASIPLIHSQLEGLVLDLTEGRQFFTRGAQKADLVDPTQLVSIEASLAALQSTYGQGVKSTQALGSLSRHGIAHGRELTYDTRVNSAKTFSVFDGVIEWALPVARDLVNCRRRRN